MLLTKNMKTVVVFALAALTAACGGGGGGGGGAALANGSVETNVVLTGASTGPNTGLFLSTTAANGLT